MSSASKQKPAPDAPAGGNTSNDPASEAGVTIEAAFSTLEERVERLAGRVRDVSAENARLRAAILEASAERDRLEKALEDARELSARQAELDERLSRYELEREAVRTRIQRLLQNLEDEEGSLNVAPPA